MISSNVPATKSCKGGSNDCINLKLNLTYTSSYCGGAAPTPEILEEHRKQKILANVTIRVIKAGEEGELVVKTDEKGSVKVCLKEGNYKLYL
ncbi:MAG TPA: hypothetical protein VIK89_01680, partial [Cytophagaceae bacterium]